jgi:hypothetical protein
VRDSRLVGSMAENVFLSILNERGVFATSFDTVAFDGIVYDTNRRYFKVGDPPSYVQIKCRGSEGEQYNSQGHSSSTINRMRQVAQDLGIPESSLYFVVGFFKHSDIRTVVYYCIPLEDWVGLGRLPPANTGSLSRGVSRRSNLKGSSSRSSSRSSAP